MADFEKRLAFTPIIWYTFFMLRLRARFCIDCASGVYSFALRNFLLGRGGGARGVGFALQVAVFSCWMLVLVEMFVFVIS
jgi:hypothetical protein